MGREVHETDDEREARLKQAGDWLDAELRKRTWSQRYLAEQLGVTQQQVSAYVNGRSEIGRGVAGRLAALLGMRQIDVWRALHKDLPDDVIDEQAEIAYYEARYPEVFAEVARILGKDYPGGKHRRPPVRRPRITPRGENRDDASRDTASGI